MSNLRSSTKAMFVERLEDSYFSAANFSVTYPNGYEIVVNYIPRPQFQFSVETSFEGFKTIESPSEHLLSQETFVREDINECVYALSQWVTRIEEEYRTSNPVVDEFEAFRASIADRLQQEIENEHDRFDPQQVESLRKRLDEFAAKLAEMSEKTSGFEDRLSKATSEIEALKNELQTAPRGVWYRKASGKFLSAIKSVVTSKEGRAFALEAAKKFLLEGPS